jgi:hypothetical protein
MIDSLAIAIFLVVAGFIEVARLDKIMKTVNTSGHRQRKSAAACVSSEDSDEFSTESSEEDDYPDWRLMLKHVEGNHKLFKKTPIQLKLNDLEKRFDLRAAESCGEFNTGTEKE